VTPPDERDLPQPGSVEGQNGGEGEGTDDRPALWIWRPTMTVVPRPDGTFFVAMADPLRIALRLSVEELRNRLLGESPSIKRLFPTAYPDHPDLESEYRDLMYGELMESRLASLDLVESTLDESVLTEAQLVAWAQVINGVRLAIGTELDVEETGLDLEDDDPRWPAYALYEQLGLMLASIVEVLPT